ncbi:unnamed protein product [Clonostachys chloroleuca]|uniref:Uncharacterized protein n=1 Tax=Clonostachys chloroleuca TaxID=1926264 RepID=A0AA35ME18_9HYPO|nr:unnamed protein product [Clonostachys chloroleuca]
MDDPEGAGLPLRRLDQVAWAYGRYNRIFEDPDTIQERIPNTNYLDAGITAKSPWIIEAPSNTVEIIEAILKPKEPFNIDSRSCLQPGTIPLPECIWDWFAGITGKEEAAPYYWRKDGVDTIQEKDGSSDSKQDDLVDINDEAHPDMAFGVST